MGYPSDAGYNLQLKKLPNQKASTAIDGKVGYALGGGAARGLFHIGVLKVLDEYAIVPDVIAGTSMGAVIGALYACGLKAAEIEQLALQIDWKQLFYLTDITVPLSGCVQGKRIDALLSSIIKDKTFLDLEIKFACVATDLANGKQTIFREGLVTEAVRASISVPMVFTPKQINGRYFVDGGLVNQVPVSVCREMGADYVIGVNTISGRPIENVITDIMLHYKLGFHKLASQTSHSFFIGKNSMLPGDPNIMDVLIQTMHIIEQRIALENMEVADLPISPMMDNVGFWEFHKSAKAISAGEQTAQLILATNSIYGN